MTVATLLVHSLPALLLGLNMFENGFRGIIGMFSMLLWASWHIPIGYPIHIQPKMELGARVYLGHGFPHLLIDFCWFLTFRDLSPINPVPSQPFQNRLFGYVHPSIWFVPFAMQFLPLGITKSVTVDFKPSPRLLHWSRAFWTILKWPDWVYTPPLLVSPPGIHLLLGFAHYFVDRLYSEYIACCC